MGVFVLKDASVVLNSVDLSDHVRSVTVTHSGEIIDTTAMTANSKAKISGLKDWSVDIEFNQDFAASEVDATINGLVGAAAVSMVVKPTSSAVSATNPSYTGNVLVADYPILSGGIGSLATTTVKFEGTGDLTRATA